MRLWSSSRVHVAALYAISLAVFLQYGLWEHPIFGDRAYFIYQGQTILRGESIYASSFLGYPPLGPLLSAAAMWIGRWFDLPTYLAPRCLGLLIGVTNPALVYAIARTATGSAGAGFVAGLVLAAFAEYAGFSVSNLEPKVLVMSFSLAAGLALQHRRFGAVGFAAGLAGMCWQPAVFVALATAASIWWGAPGERARAAVRYAIGMALALAPSALYLTLEDAWLDFWQRFFTIQASLDVPGIEHGALFWLERVMARRFATDIGFFVAGGVGFAFFALESLLRGVKTLPSTWLDLRLAAFPVLTLLWVVFNSVDFQGVPDMLPILPSLAFWAGWLVQRSIPGSLSNPGRGLVFVGVALVVAGYGFADAVRFKPANTIEHQKTAVRRLLGPEERNRVVAFSAESFYVLSERPAPLPVLRMNKYFEPFAKLIDPKGCNGVIRRTLAFAPDVVVTRSHSAQGRCIHVLHRALIRDGFELHKMVFYFREHRSFDPSKGRFKKIVWNRFSRPPPE